MVVPCRDSNSFCLFINSHAFLVVHESAFRAPAFTLGRWTIPRTVLLSVCPIGGSRNGTRASSYLLYFARQVGRTSSTRFPLVLLVHPRELVFPSEGPLWSCSGQASENQCLGVSFALPAVS